MAAKTKSKSKISKLDELLKCKFVEYDMGTLEIKEKLANALNILIREDKKLLSLIITEALENYDIYSLASEYEKRFNLHKNKEEFKGIENERDSL